MSKDKAHPHPRIVSIHNPHLRGDPTLLMPEGLLVRWPERTPLPSIGEQFEGTIVRVPEEVRETVLILLFAPCALARCDAADRLGANTRHRRRILHALFSRSYIQKLRTSAKRLQPEQRERMKAQGKSVSYRRLVQAALAAGSRSSQVAKILSRSTRLHERKSTKS